jgi:hypothetical protein
MENLALNDLNSTKFLRRRKILKPRAAPWELGHKKNEFPERE